MKNAHFRKHLTLSIAGLLFLCTLTASSQQQHPTIKDNDDSVYDLKLLLDGRLWMTSNLNTGIRGSSCYDNLPDNCKKFGRLYTWKAAQEGCNLLGNGWHLPTNEEWQTMGKRYGGVVGDSDDGGKSAYLALIPGGESGFNIQFGGGGRDNSYARLNAHGFYWTATETDSTHAWFYNFGTNGKMMNHHNDGEKSRTNAVRCVKR